MPPHQRVDKASRVFATPSNFATRFWMAKNNGSNTLYHEKQHNSVQNSSSFATPTERVANQSGTETKGWVANRAYDELVKRLRELRGKGFWFRIHMFTVGGHTYIYVKARKKVGGNIKEITIARIEKEQLEKVKDLIKKTMNSSDGKNTGSLRRQGRNKSSLKGNKRKTKNSSAKESPNSTPNINSSSKQDFREKGRIHGGDGDREGVGGSVVCGAGRKCFGFLVHRLVLRFVRPWVVPVFLHGLGGVRFVGRSRQWVVRLDVGVGRRLTLQVNRDGTAQVFLEASGNPLDVGEFLGFCRFYLLSLFYRLTGRRVSLGDFMVMSAPEFNIDLDGVNLLEGLGAKSLTLERYLSDVVRIYYSDPGVKSTMPSGGTRVEARPSSYRGMDLKELVEGVAAAAELPRFLSVLKKDVEEVKELVRGGVSLKGLEKQGFADLVASRLANYLEILWRRVEERLKQWIKEVAVRIANALQSYVDELLQRIKVLEEENKQLRNRIRELEDKLGSMGRIEEYKKHPGWKKLLELATPGPDHPALINIDLEKGMVYYSPELWRYIRSRTISGSLRGLDKHLLSRVRDYHGEWAVKLLLMMQMHGGKIGLSKALSVLDKNNV